jgi:hypothetical protein
MNEPIIMRHVWLMFIAVTIANAMILKIRSGPYILQHPELAEGYRRLFWGVLFWCNLPWLVMAIGIEFGSVPNIFFFFRPRDGNPFVLGFFGVVVLLWILGFYWIFARRGADFLIDHPGLLRGCPKNPDMIKLFYCLSVIGGIVGMILMFTMDIPIPFAK